MSGNQHQDPSAGTLIISALLVLNAIVLKDGYTSGSMGYSWLFITVPLFFIALFYGRQPRKARRTRSAKSTKRLYVGGVGNASTRFILKNQAS